MLGRTTLIQSHTLQGVSMQVESVSKFNGSDDILSIYPTDLHYFVGNVLLQNVFCNKVSNPYVP